MRKIYILFFALLSASLLHSQEICNNGIDDDADGLIDLNDVTDCVCGQSAITSLIPNPSFETMNCCPSTFSQMNCAGSWIQASSATSDYMNTCGMVFAAATNAGLVPFPNGNGIVGTIFSPGWQEYVGACLLSPMTAGTPYTLQMNIASTPIDNYGGVCNGGVIDFGPIDIVIYGTTNCANLPFAGYACPPSPQWVVLGQTNYSPVSSWGLINITFTPTANITGVIIGSPCTLPASYSPPSGCYPYFYYDNLLLNTTTSFNTVSQSGSFCTNNMLLTTPAVAGATYQWYLNGVAIVGETGLTLDISGGGYPPGSYSVMTTDINGCAVSTITVASSPSVTSLFTNTTVCVGAATTFTDNSSTTSGTISSWSWDFGDPASAPNNTSTLQNPTHIFSAAGTYNVILVSTASTGCSATTTIQVTVNPLPTPSFVYNQVCQDVLVNFTSTSTVAAPSTITGTAWNFGDPASGGNNTSTLSNPSHTFTGVGNYVVTLVVTTSGGCTQTTTQTITVSPQVSAAFIATSVCPNSPMQFTNQSLNSTIYHWDFGVASATNDTSNVPNPTYTYTASGTYNVTLIANPGSCSDTSIVAVTVNPGPAIAFTAPQVCLGSPTSFTDQTVITSGIISSWHWDFGVGSLTNDTSNIQNPNYTYTSAGTYNVTLTCTSNNGCTGTLTIPVVVNSLPTANFSSTVVCQGVPSVFTDLSLAGAGNITNWNWDFGDGSPSSSTQSPSHTYSNDSTYNVTLIVTNTAGCIDTIVLPVVTNANPLVAFSADTLSGCPTLCVNFTDQTTISSASIIGWTWDFGDGSSASYSQNPSHCFPTGTYSITLTSVSSTGCASTLMIPNMIDVYPVPFASFSAFPNPTTIISPFVSFTDLSSGSPVIWHWDFGDGSTFSDTADTQNADYTYSSEYGATYPVYLQVTNQYGCVDDTTIYVIVEPDFEFFIPNCFTPNGDLLNDGFFGKGYGIEKYELWVFDRWGNLIFNTKDINDAWDGSVAGKGGDIAQEDVYVWKVVLTDVFNKKHKYIGHVTLIK